MSDLPDKVCIIGAGSSGITAAKTLKDFGIPFDCYEAGDRVGGNWVYENSNGMSSAYKSLHINTSKPRMEYSDYPMPADYPDFPHHAQIAEYFNNYVEHFGVKQFIRFNTKVTSAEPLEGGGWEITLDDGAKHRYRALLVANGHHWNPRWPDPPFPGHFDGEISHSHYYKTAEGYEDKNVLVLGFGNSAMDIAVETSRVSKMTYLAVRRGFHIIPKHIFGKPLDQIPVPAFMPVPLQLYMYRWIIRLQVGKLSDYGLPEPDYPILHAHPTVSSEILIRLSSGRVKVKPNIARLDGDGVIFKDGSREKIDKIIYCTGYKVTFPFLRPELVEAKNNEVPLFKRIFHPRYPDLFFVGLFQPLGAIMPLAEAQSKWISRYLLGETALPSPAEMEQTIRKDREAIRKRYGNAPRHTMQVDAAPYMLEMLKEEKAGTARPLPATPLIRRKDLVGSAGATANLSVNN